jgi:prolyl-tRNA synthetase
LKQAGIRVKTDDRADVTPGWKFNEYEMRGIPIRIELGPRDMENGQIVLVSRIGTEKRIVQQENLVAEVQQMLEDIQRDMFINAKQFLDSNLISVDTLDEMGQYLETKRGFVLAGWCGSEACEAQVKEETGATSRNIPFSPEEHKTHCLVCGEASQHTVLFGRAY